MSNVDTKKDWVIVQTIHRQLSIDIVEYLREIWKTEFRIVEREEDKQKIFLVYTKCTEAVQSDIYSKADGFRAGWNQAKFG